MFREWFQSLPMRWQDAVAICTTLFGSMVLTALIGHIYDKWIDHKNKLLDKHIHRW